MTATEDIALWAVARGELEIDSEGRIWRVAARRGGRWGIRIIPCERRRAENLTASGYLQIRVMRDGVRVNALAHRVVYANLHGPIPGGLTVNHINGVKHDNRPANMELATPSEQVIHARAALGKMSQKGAKNNAAKLTAAQVAEIRSRRLSGDPLKAIATDYGISDRTVSKIALRRRWRG